jgi:serine/threonine protein kinase
MRYCSRCLQTFGGESPPRCPRAACGRARPHEGWPSYLALGERVEGRYEVDSVLGAGATGIAYRCWDPQGQEWVALKVLHGDRHGGALALRFAIEADVLQLFDHPHIVPFRAVNIVQAPHHYLVTRYMEGGSVEAWIRRHGAFRPAAAAAIGRQMALALYTVHEAGIVHRDLKPGNVLLEGLDADAPHIRLADFGIARIWRALNMGPSLTRTGAFIGTPEYAAPEQVRGEKGVGPAADAYALGVFLHFVACGEQVIRRKDYENWEEFVDRARDPQARPRLTERLRHEPDQAGLKRLDVLIDGLLAERPELRPGMEEVARRLGATDAQITRPAVPVLPPQTLVSVAEGALDPDGSDSWDHWEGAEVEDAEDRAEAEEAEDGDVNRFDWPVDGGASGTSDEDEASGHRLGAEDRVTEPVGAGRVVPVGLAAAAPMAEARVAPSAAALPSPLAERREAPASEARGSAWIVAALLVLAGMAGAAWIWTSDPPPGTAEAPPEPETPRPAERERAPRAPYRRVEVPSAPEHSPAAPAAATEEAKAPPEAPPARKVPAERSRTSTSGGSGAAAPDRKQHAHPSGSERRATTRDRSGGKAQAGKAQAGKKAADDAAKEATPAPRKGTPKEQRKADAARKSSAAPPRVAVQESSAVAQAPVGPVDGWARDPADPRALVDVVGDEVLAQNASLPEEIRRTMEEAERRAAFHEAVRRRDAARVAELGRQWDEALSDSRGVRGECEGAEGDGAGR